MDAESGEDVGRKKKHTHTDKLTTRSKEEGGGNVT